MFIDKRLKVHYYTILKWRLSLKVLEGSLSFRQPGEKPYLRFVTF